MATMALPALPKLSRFINIRTYFGVNNHSIKSVCKIQQNLACSTNAAILLDQLKTELQPKPKKKISKAMRAYIDRSREHDEFMKKEVAEYNIGKRHLANIMGEDPENFTQEDIDRAIAYLFPSGIYDPLARPLMQRPEKIFSIRKAAEFDESGRPFHFLYYTGRPNYYMSLHNILDQLDKLDRLEDAKIAKGIRPHPNEKMNLIGSVWFTALELEKLFLESMIDTKYYPYLIKSLERLADHPLSSYASDFIMQYRKPIISITREKENLPLLYDSTGRPYVVVTGCTRKTSRATVILRGEGSGKITINGIGITYFNDVQCQEQVVFPLMFTGMAQKIDVEATVESGGPTGQSGAIRWGIAWGLRSFVDKDMNEKMRIAGLLTRDWRRRERKKPGQEGARRKFSWNKR